MPRLLFGLLAFVGAGCAGCGAEPSAGANAPDPPPASEPASAFSPANCGSVTGLVTWAGAIPDVLPVTDVRPNAAGVLETRTVTHPYAPRIDRFTHALAGAVVSLRGVDPARSKPWDLPGAEVEFRDGQIVVTQGASGRVGFVRKGEVVRFQSREPGFNVLRGRGANFFAIPFPDADKPAERRFDALGRVELSSAAGFSWQAADLFVCDHPYHAVTDSAGRFRFEQVPEGEYELVGWHPNWVVTATERNPETGLVQRLSYAPPLEQRRSVRVTAGRATLANLTLPK